MVSLEDIRHQAEEVVATYASRLVTLSKIIGEAYGLLSRGRSEREVIRAELRDLLAVGNSLRRKDFDLIIGEIFNEQKSREDAIETSLQRFLKEQGKTAERLKEGLQQGDVVRVKSTTIEMEKGIAEMMDMLSNFRGEEQRLEYRLKSLLARGNALTIPEFKTAVRDIKSGTAVNGRSLLTILGCSGM